MAYCKRCVCGYLNVYEKAGGSPLYCQRDGRPLFGRSEEPYEGQPEFIDPNAKVHPQDPQPEAVAQPVEEPPMEEAENTADSLLDDMQAQRVLRYYLTTPAGHKYQITGEAIVGRLGLAKDYLISFRDVGREHCVITPSASGVFAILEDRSRFGTYLNEVRVQKETPVPLTSGSVLRLASQAKLKFVIEEGTADA